MEGKFRLYIDEVGNSDLRSSENVEHRFLTLAGIICKIDYIKEIVHPELEGLKRDFFNYHPDDPIIFHRKEIVQKKPPFSVLQDPAIENNFNERLISCLKTWDYKVISVIIDKMEHDQRYSTWKYDPYHYCQEILLERYRLFLDINNAVGDVMIESRGGREDMRLKRSFRRLMEQGTHNMGADDLQKHLTSLDLKVKSKQLNIAGLQIADLIAHPVRRWFFKNVFNMTEGKHTFADQIIEILETQKFFRYRGEIIGYGAKKLP